MSSLPGRRRSGAAPLAAVAEDWHAEQRAESPRRVHVGSRALALLAAAGILACLIVLSSGSILGGGKAGGLRRQRLEGGRRMAAEVPFAQQHTIAAGILVEPAQQRQLVPNLLAGSSEDEEEAAGSLAAAELELAGQQQPGGSQGAKVEEAELDEEEEGEEEEGEEEEGEDEEEAEDNLDEHAEAEPAAAAEQAEAAAEAAAAASEAAAAASDGAASGDKRSGGSNTASNVAAEGEDKEEEEEEELLTRDDFGLRAKRWQAEAAEATRRGGQASQPSNRQVASGGGKAAGTAAAGAAKLAAAEQEQQQEVEEGTAEEDEGAAEGGSSSRRGGPGGARKAGPAENAQPAEPAEDEAQRQQQRKREAAARAGQVSLTAGAAEMAEPRAARAEPAGGTPAAEAAAASSAPKQGSGGERKQPAQEQSPATLKSPYHLALERCNDLACLREAAQQERHPGQFLFPHALVIGFQKSAAAGLFAQLAQHPGVLAPQEQESEFFSKGCDYDPAGCSREDQNEYMQHMLRLPHALRGGLRKAVIEGSTRYAAEGPRMAKGLHEVFPWIKLVASLREPISRAVAVLASARDEASQRCLSEGALFACLKQQLPALNYTAQLDAWLEAFPAEQVMLLQYETLASPDQERMAGQLSALHTFLGLKPTAASSAGGSLQLKEASPGTRSLRIRTEEYQALVKLVRPDAKSIAGIVAQRGFGDGKQWLKSWEKVWQATLNTCTLEGHCTIRLV